MVLVVLNIILFAFGLLVVGAYGIWRLGEVYGQNRARRLARQRIRLVKDNEKQKR